MEKSNDAGARRGTFLGRVLLLTLALGSASLPARSLSLGLTSEPDCASTRTPRPVADFSISFLAADQETAGLLATALVEWRTCDQAADFPRLVEASAAMRTVRVEWDRGSSGSPVCGFFAGDRIRVFSWAVDSQGREVRCSPPAVNVAHEIGHVLGLTDAPVRSECRRHVMALDELRTPREVKPAECRAVADYWRTAGVLARRNAYRSPEATLLADAARDGEPTDAAGASAGLAPWGGGGLDYMGLMDMSHTSTMMPKALTSASIPGHFAVANR